METCCEWNTKNICVMVTPQFLFKKVMPMIFEVNNTAEDITRRETCKRPCKENW
jgi:hypothetical protein